MAKKVYIALAIALLLSGGGVARSEQGTMDTLETAESDKAVSRRTGRWLQRR